MSAQTWEPPGRVKNRERLGRRRREARIRRSGWQNPFTRVVNSLLDQENRRAAYARSVSAARSAAPPAPLPAASPVMLNREPTLAELLAMSEGELDALEARFSGGGHRV